MRSARTRAALAAALVVALAVGVLAPGGAGAAPPLASARAGAAWLAGQLTEAGYVPGPDDDPAPGDTVQSALALAAAEAEPEAFHRAVAWVEADLEDVIAPGGVDNPGGIAYAILLAVTAGADPGAFGGVDLLARLAATLGADGMYGGAVDGYDPTYSAVFNQGLALTALAGAGAGAPGAALAWLDDQRCGDGSPADAVGGWASYRADTSEPCPSPDPVSFTGPDTNSTALAVQGLVAAGADVGEATVTFLRGTQSEGGFPFLTGSGTDPNSTALVIQAIVALGQDPGSEAWAQDGADPYSSLLSWQITEGDPLDVGAFTSAWSGGLPDQIATQQAVWGAAGAPFPLPVAFPEPPVTTTTTTTTTTTVPDGPTTTAGGGGSSSTTSPAGGKVATPRYAG